MKAISFPAYDRAEQDEMGRRAVVARAWYIGMMAVSQAPAGPNAERSAQVVKLYNAFKSLMKLEGTGEAQERYLNPEGGVISLEDAETKVLKEIIDTFRANVSGAGADALVFLDDAIRNATEVPKLLA